jgi:DNA-binding MarR family transcriptional regulator
MTLTALATGVRKGILRSTAFNKLLEFSMAKNNQQRFDFDEYGAAFFDAHLHRLRVLISAQSDEIFAAHDIDVPSMSASMVLFLEKSSGESVGVIADALKYSHQLINKRIANLERIGCLRRRQDKADKRRSIVALTKRGKAEAKKIRKALRVIDLGIKDTFAEANLELQQSVHDMQQRLLTRPLSVRGKSQSKEKLIQLANQKHPN